MIQFVDLLRNAGNDLVVVDFYATWCGPCKAISPKIEELAQQLRGRVQFLKVDVDDDPDIAQQLEITAMPTFVFFRNSVEVGRVVGASLTNIINKITELDPVHLDENDF